MYQELDTWFFIFYPIQLTTPWSENYFIHIYSWENWGLTKLSNLDTIIQLMAEKGHKLS